MCGTDAGYRIHPLEPDILGEFFTLERLENEPRKASAWIEHAWNNHPVGIAQFADRCGQDFIEHDAIKLLHAVKPENATGQLAWAMLAVILIHAYGDAERFGEARTLCDDLKHMAETDDSTPDIRLVQAHGTFFLLHIYCKAGQLVEASSLYGDLKTLAGADDATSEIRLIHAAGAVNLIIDYGKAGRLGEAVTLYDDLKTLAGADDATAEFRLWRARGASALSACYMTTGALTEARIHLDTLNELAKELDDEKLLAGRTNLQEELEKREQAAKPGAVEQAEEQEAEPVEPHILPQTVPQAAQQVVPQTAPVARHQPSTAVRLLQGAVLLILSTVLLTLVFTAVVIASEPHLRGLIDQLGGAGILHDLLHHLVDFVVAGIKALP